MINRQIELFVPGRLALAGDHSDWAGGHRRQNSKLEKGYVIVAQTNQVTKARVRGLEERILVVHSTESDEVLRIPMEEKALASVADEGGFFSYICGVAHCIVQSFDKHIQGLGIDNYETTLPVKKGLSSSASICVLTARALNQIYDLRLTKRAEMEYAYQGEIMTPSRCGRQDQACAFEKPVLMTFDGDRIGVEELRVGKDLYMVIVDLCSEKNTRQILTDLHNSFPFARAGNPHDEQVQKYLGPINKQIVLSIKQAIEEGDAEKVGHFMKESQQGYDEYLIPRCAELRAPKLHRVLEYSPIQSLIYGGRWVGSGGDGCAQLLAKGEEEQKELIKILEHSDLEVKCYELNVKAN